VRVRLSCSKVVLGCLLLGEQLRDEKNSAARSEGAGCTRIAQLNLYPAEILTALLLDPKNTAGRLSPISANKRWVHEYAARASIARRSSQELACPPHRKMHQSLAGTRYSLARCWGGRRYLAVRSLRRGLIDLRARAGPLRWRPSTGPRQYPVM
jgi:hypothetical protein